MTQNNVVLCGHEKQHNAFTGHSTPIVLIVHQSFLNVSQYLNALMVITSGKEFDKHNDLSSQGLNILSFQKPNDM